MNRYALFHRPESSFAYATAPDTIAVILKAAQSDKFDRVEILYNNKYNFTKGRKTLEMRRCAEDGTFAYYRADISLPDARFAYIFKLMQKGKIYYYSEDGLSEDYKFDAAYYTFFQFPFINWVDVQRGVDWTKSAVFYQIFVDRFARGDYEKEDLYVNTAWNERTDRYSFTGGDLQGILNKLPYLKNAGVNALYLTPVFCSPSNHKYNVTDYLNVDPQFGTNEKLIGLLASAHAEGIKVLVDCVFNHCDRNHEFFKDVEEKGRNSKYYDWFLIDGDFPSADKGNYACFAYCKNMPKWNTNNGEVRRYLIDIALEYLKMGFDGLRLDVADEISHEMWRQLRREIKAVNPQAYIVGEVWHLNEHWLKGDQFDGVMNYKLQKILVDYFGASRITAQQASDRMNGLLMQNTEQAHSMALNFLDNHDTPRFLRFTGGNKDKLLGALCAIIVFPGIPCIFYGTELPLDGGGDPDCRQPFDWTFENQTNDYAEKFKAVLSLKKKCEFSDAQAEITAEDGVLKITRKVSTGAVTAYFNMSGKAHKIAVSGNVIFSLNYNDGKILNDGTVVIENNQCRHNNRVKQTYEEIRW